MLESLFEYALEEHRLVLTQFALAPEAVMLPFPSVLVYFIEPVGAGTAALSFYKLPFVDVTIIVSCLAKAMRLGPLPGA